MCGFAGFLTADASALGSPQAVATRMALAIAHRGPDDAGAWADAQAGIALGHRPMYSPNRQFPFSIISRIKLKIK